MVGLGLKAKIIDLGHEAHVLGLGFGLAVRGLGLVPYCLVNITVLYCLAKSVV